MVPESKKGSFKSVGKKAEEKQPGHETKATLPPHEARKQKRSRPRPSATALWILYTVPPALTLLCRLAALLPVEAVSFAPNFPVDFCRCRLRRRRAARHVHETA